MDTVFFNGRAALLDFIGGVRDDFSERLDRFNASKALQRSLRSEVSDGITMTATLSALDYWRFVGNGRGPGKMPPSARLAKWALVKGLASTEAQARSIGYLIARNIAREGTLDYQLGGKNQAGEAIKAAQPKVEDVLKVFLRDIDKAEVSQFNKAFAA